MHNMVSAHFSGHHQTCIPQPMKEIIQIIQLQIFFFLRSCEHLDVCLTNTYNFNSFFIGFWY